jgi:peptidoglycan/xylan/chitin deacetylase (PgdA/CDA1 family)
VRYPVLRPPYVYRWAVLITVLSTAVALVVAGLQALGADAQPAGTAHSTPSVTPSTAGVQPVPAELVQHTTDTGRVVALTFDDGPYPEYTPQVLALLARYGAIATFCIVGVEAQRHPELVRAVAAAGMGLCSHTMSHDENMPAKSDAQIETEIVGCQRAIATALGEPAVAGASVRYFRAPAGHWSERIQQIAAGNGMRPLAWSIDSRDWQRPGAAQIVAAVQQAVQPGAVVLLHDGGGRREQTLAALAELLPWLVEQGYRFVLPT